jgi:hypothetical protein
MTEILLKVVLNTIRQTKTNQTLLQIAMIIQVGFTTICAVSAYHH